MFECANKKCKAYENTALSGAMAQKINGIKEPFCSACNPDIGKWHGKFPKLTLEEHQDPANAPLFKNESLI